MPYADPAKKKAYQREYNRKWYAENKELNNNSHALTFGLNYVKDGKFEFTGSDMISLDNALLKGRERSYFTDLNMF